MAEPERDLSAELSRRELEEAAARNAEMNKVVEEAHRTSLGIRVIVQENGYVSRFRKVLRGA